MIELDGRTLRDLATVSKAVDNVCKELGFSLALEVKVELNEEHIATIYHNSIEINQSVFV